MRRTRETITTSVEPAREQSNSAWLSQVPGGVATIAIVFATLACQVERAPDVNESTGAILGGVAIEQGDYPTVVGVVISGFGLCTGTLVAPQWVLTAAHCITPALFGLSSQAEVTQRVTVVFDATTIGSTGTTVRAAETIPRPKFLQPTNVDIGLIRLSAPRTDRVPTAINYEFEQAPPGVIVDMVGYGRFDLENPELAGQGFLLEQKQTLTCPPELVADANFLCFDQMDGTGKCSGDSGGPSFATIDGEQKLVGITSFGDRDCEIIGIDQRTDAFAAKAFIRTAAPDLFCIEDGYCQPRCRLASLPDDPDCSACATDSDCSSIAEGVLCETSSGSCYAGTEAIGGLGQPCGEPGLPECISGLCAERDGVKSCSQNCKVDPNSCPADFECVSIDDANNGVCLVDEGGCGCTSTDSSSGLGAGLLMLLSLVLIRRRKERR